MNAAAHASYIRPADGVRAADLAAGDVFIMPDQDSRQWLYAISDEHPGTPQVVTSVEPWILSAGPRAGKPAMRGRKPLLSINTASGVSFASTADDRWLVVGVVA